MGRPDWQRDYPRPWPDRLPSSDQAVDNTRYHHHEQPPSDSSRPLSIERALREQCKIPAQAYFLSAILDTGEAVTFSGPTEYKERIPAFFDVQRWMQSASGQSPSVLDENAGFEDYQRSQARSRARQGSTQSQDYGLMEYDGRRGSDRRRIPGLGIEEYTDDAGYRRKRVRAGTSRRPGDVPDELPVRVTQPTKVPVRIGDEKQIWSIYDQRFRGLQQTACKLIAKAWVKVVEPKKQSTHPYTGSDEKAPDWWPKPWGPSRDERVRHKEPDHLYKKERVHLLKHILRMIVLPPSDQHPDIQKLRLNVAKLEEATIEALSSFFTDKDSPNNARKRPYLKEIFMLAKNEERFHNGEIDATTNVYIMSDDKIPDNYRSDNEEVSPGKEDEEDVISSTLSPHHSSTQGAMMSANVSPGATGSEHSPSGSLPSVAAAQTFMGDLPHRGHPAYAPPQILHPDIGDQHSGFVDNSGIATGGGHGGMSLQDMLPNPNETNRRSSLFSPSAEFSSTSTASAVYQWQHGTTAPNATPMYAAFTPQQAQAQGPFVAQNQNYMRHPFDGMAQGTYETGHDGLYRSGNVTTAGVNPQAGYAMHMGHPDPRSMSGHGLKVESSSRTHMH